MALVPAGPCPVCGGSARRALYPIRDLVYEQPGSWTFAVCEDCGHGLIDPRPDEDGLAAIYASYYDATVTGFMARFNESGLVRRFHRARVAALLAAIRGRSVRRVVDVGCGLGHFLRDLRRALRAAGSQVEAIGVEPGPAAADHASGLLREDDGAGPPGRVLRCQLGDLDISAASVDVLTMNHLLEHHPRPDLALRRAADLVAPGGVIEVEVPRMGGLPRRLLGRWWWLHIPPQHLHLFTREGLPRLLSRSGFEPIVSVRTAGLPLHLSLAWRFWLRNTLGGHSRFAGRKAVQVAVWTLGLAVLLPLLLLDLLFGPLHSLLGGGDVLTVVARRAGGQPGS